MSLGISFLGENFCFCQVCRKQGNENETDCWEARVGTSFPSCRQCCVLLRLLTLSWGLNLESDSWVSSPQDCGWMGHPRGLQLPWVVRMAAPVSQETRCVSRSCSMFPLPWNRQSQMKQVSFNKQITKSVSTRLISNFSLCRFLAWDPLKKTASLLV